MFLDDPEALNRTFEKQIKEFDEIKTQLGAILPPNSKLDEDFNKLANNIED